MKVQTIVYLRTSQVAALLGLGVSTIKRLADADQLPAARTGGAHRLFEPEQVLKYAREHGLPVAELERLIDEEAFRDLPRTAAEPNGVPEDLIDGFERSLRRGRQEDAREIAFRVFESHGGTQGLGDELIRPAMERLGSAWHSGNFDVFQEHRATRMVEHLLVDLNWRIQQANSRTARKGRPLAIGAAPEDDPYTVSGLLCEMLLREQGWDVMNLGPNLPLKSLARAVDTSNPRLIWLSVSYLENPDQFVADYRLFYETATRHNAAVMLGGQALHAELRPQLRCSAFGERLAHLADFARSIHPFRSNPGTTGTQFS